MKFFSLFPLFLSFLSSLPFTNADRNITIDDSSTSVLNYSPASAWTHYTGDAENNKWLGNTSSSTAQANASVSLTFTGTAIYYFAGTGTDKTTATIYLDDDSYEVPLYANPGHLALMLWSIKVPNGEHTFKLVQSDVTGSNVALDQLIYTVSTENSVSGDSDSSSSSSAQTTSNSETSPITSSSTSSSSSSSTSKLSNSAHGSHPTSTDSSAGGSSQDSENSSNTTSSGGRIAGAVVGGFAALGLVGAAGWYLWRRRKQNSLNDTHGFIKHNNVTVIDEATTDSYDSFINRPFSINPFINTPRTATANNNHFVTPRE